MKHKEPVWKDKNVVVTGASSGIGRAIAEQLLGEGAHVVAMARRIQRLQTLPGAYACTVDLADEKTIRPAAQGALHIFESMSPSSAVDAVFSVAGIGSITPAEYTDEQDYDRLMQVNVRGARTLIDALQPALADDARIIRELLEETRLGEVAANTASRFWKMVHCVDRK